ncbi:MAG TPA: sigma 54-interacting transcriptional regulator [Smithella sp.]|nr:sigma 54-interacting transcriptional regulator [Smithella sp.]
MIVNENEFFHQMTMLICSSLDIEIALRRSFNYFVKVLPVDRIFLHLYEQNVGAIQTIIEVTATGSRRLDKITPLTREGRTILDRSLERSDASNTRIVNRPENDPIEKIIAESFKMPNSSALLMRLIVESKKLGTLALMVEGVDQYTEDHARLLNLLSEPFAIALSNALMHQEVLRLKDMLIDDNRYLHQELSNLSGNEIIGSDFGLKDVAKMIRRVAPLQSPVLLLGETGVGKGVMANAIHHLSHRNKGPFITVNSGAIPETLIDSELFGHEKGAFTGAIDQIRGRFERAHQGTIFLDEIGELPPQVQVRMLRVLEEKVIERVGGSKPVPVDIRIIAATHRNLNEMVKANQFREDLWFRINVFPIRIPPLRERKEDILSLVHYFIKKKTRELKLTMIPELAHGATDCLMNYDWPGNVRELENAVEREMILNKNEPLAFKALGDKEKRDDRSTALESINESNKMDAITTVHIQRVLTMTHGVVHGPNGAAALLGINPSTLRSRMKKLGIPYGRRK